LLFNVLRDDSLLFNLLGDDSLLVVDGHGASLTMKNMAMRCEGKMDDYRKKKGAKTRCASK
jgi:hypothetical protein